MADPVPYIDFESLGSGGREQALFDDYCKSNPSPAPRSLGRVIRLDRGFPLVCCAEGTFRAEHAVALIKRAESLSCVGDWVVLALPEGHDQGLIEEILPRKQVLTRQDPAERTGRQVLAANIDLVFLLHALSGERINVRRLEREMVSAYDSGATPVVVLTKADLATDLDADLEDVRRVVHGIEVIVESVYDGRGIERIRALIDPSKTAVLLGSSGVGKSALTNALVGGDFQRTGAVRASDGRGRHTTVSRDLFLVRDGGVVIDTPGIRSISLWDPGRGFAAAFPEIAEAARECRFSDCTHSDEPGCAVLAAVREGRIEQRRFASWRDLQREAEENAERREERRRMEGRKHERGKTATGVGRRPQGRADTSKRQRWQDDELQQELDDYRYGMDDDRDESLF